MYSVDECVSRARKACVEMFGQRFVEEHKKDFCSTRYEDKENHIVEYSLLYAPYREPNSGNNITIQETQFEYYASVVVDMTDGSVIKDPDSRKTRLPA